MKGCRLLRRRVYGVTVPAVPGFPEWSGATVRYLQTASPTSALRRWLYGEAA